MRSEPCAFLSRFSLFAYILKQTQTHTIIVCVCVSPLPENQKDENRKMWKLKDVKIVAAEISLIILYRYTLISLEC